jgi:DNA-binding MurR/RpiR family transcriptional regulator
MSVKSFDRTLDPTRIKAYGDTMNDGKVQLSFTLPVKDDERGMEAARQLARKMGLEEPNVAGAVKLDAAPDKPLRDSDDPIELARRLYAVESEAMLQTLSLLRPAELDKAVAVLRDARKVLCMGQGGSMILASEAAHLFSVYDGKFVPVSDSHMQVIAAATLTEADAVLFFSYSGATKDMMETLTVVREQGAKIILITRFPRSPGAQLADVVLQCGSNESPLEHGSVPARIAQLFLLDILFTRVTLTEPDGCRANRQRIAAALADKHL